MNLKELFDKGHIQFHYSNNRVRYEITLCLNEQLEQLEGIVFDYTWEMIGLREKLNDLLKNYETTRLEEYIKVALIDSRVENKEDRVLLELEIGLRRLSERSQPANQVLKYDDFRKRGLPSELW